MNNYTHFGFNGEPISLAKWLELFKSPAREVSQEVVDGYYISTVWIGVDVGYTGSNPPQVFETMVFSDLDSFDDLYCAKYSTRDEAIAGHAEVIEMIKTGEITR